MRTFGSFAILAMLCCSGLSAQAPAPPVIENRGLPIRIPFACTPEEVGSFGLTCPEDERCTVYLELAAVESVGNKLFVAGNLHTASVTLYSVLLASEDEGKTWSEPFRRLRSSGLDQIQFLDFERGWISGVVLESVPRDPFLLLTTDGGKTWRERPVFAESRTGLIERFRFDTKDHGLAWIDRSTGGDPESRYELYESETGGGSWMLREASAKPIPDKQPRVREQPGWRLRADRATKSYAIERREQGRWRQAASFLVEAGECREPELKLAEPPPPDEPSRGPVPPPPGEPERGPVPLPAREPARGPVPPPPGEPARGLVPPPPGEPARGPVQ